MFRIIIADDHPIVLQALKTMLREEFPQAYIEEAVDTGLLLEKVAREDWDLVISDLAMPGGGGLIALRKIKQLKKDLPVIIVSTYPSDQYKASTIKAGAEDFVCKDTFPGELVAAIRRVFDKYKK